MTSSQLNENEPANLKERVSDIKRRRFDLEYDGTDFFGWQLQNDVRTVQGVCESALEQLVGIPCRVQGAGRTDAGVHAFGQVVHADLPAKFSMDVLLKGINHFLPADVRALRVTPVPSDFHSRFSAQWRYYCYTVYQRSRAVGRQYGWYPNFQFNSSLLDKLASALLEVKEYTAFSAVDSEVENHQCDVKVAFWEDQANEFKFHIVADRFLRHMVRMLVGTMLETARGRFSEDQFLEMLHTNKSDFSVYTAPACGLCLMRVGYGKFPYLETDEIEIQRFPNSL